MQAIRHPENSPKILFFSVWLNFLKNDQKKSVGALFFLQFLIFFFFKFLGVSNIFLHVLTNLTVFLIQIWQWKAFKQKIHVSSCWCWLEDGDGIYQVNRYRLKLYVLMKIALPRWLIGVLNSLLGGYSVSLIPGWGEVSFWHIFASHLCWSMWEKYLMALERKLC